MITRRRQIQAVANHLAGRPPGLKLEQLTDDFQYLLEIITSAGDKHSAIQDLIRVKNLEEDLADLVDDVLATDPSDGWSYTSLAQIGPDLPDISWLWPQWIPNGLLTVLAAWPGIGKTYIALDLAKRIIHGQDAPDDTPLHTTSRNVIYVDAEDFLPAIWSRISAWQMDSSQLYPFRRPPRDILDLNSREYQDQLIDMVYDLKPDLIIVDSLSGINPKSENNIEDMREIMNFLSELPEKFNTACLLIHHLRKPGKNHRRVTMHDLRGTSHLTAVARSIIGMDSINPHNPNSARWLRIIKTNLCPYPKPLAVQFSQNLDHPNVADLDYEEDPLLLPDTLTGDCAEWLLETLAEEPKSRQELIDLAAKHDPPFSKPTIDRARREILNDQIEDTLGPNTTGNKWKLAEEVSSNDQDDN